MRSGPARAPRPRRRARPARGLVQVGGDVAVDGVEQQGGVGGAAGERAVTAEAVEGLGVGPGGDAASLRLEADQPGPGGGDGDRPRPVGAERGRDDTGGDGGSGTAAGTARRVVGVPGVAGGAVQGGLGEVPLADLGRVGLADRDCAGRAQAAHHLRVADRGAAAAAAEGAGVARQVDVVLDRDRHAEQRRVVVLAETAVGLLGGRQRLLGADHAEGVEGLLGRLGTLERRLDQLARRRLSVRSICLLL